MGESQGPDAGALSILLSSAGVSRRLAEKAAGEGNLAQLALDRLLFPHRDRFDRNEAAKRAGVDLETARRLWRALGLPEIDDDVPVFSEDDAEALANSQRIRMLIDGTAPGVDAEAMVLRFARLIGSSMARLAAAETEAIAEIREAIASENPDAPGGITETGLQVISEYLGGIGTTLDFIHRRHLLSALLADLTRDALGDEASVESTIGFADMEGFTTLSRALDSSELADLVSRFAEAASTTITANGGRVVKTIGDEVLFLVEEPRVAGAIALELAAQPGPEDPPVRLGLATGPVLRHEGDCFGPVVNLAHRIVGAAHPGTVLVDEATHDALKDDPAFAWRRIRARDLKGIGRTRLWVMRSREQDEEGETESA